MAAGRRPKPTALKVLQGNPGKRPINGGEPNPVTAANAKAPVWMHGRARRLWSQIAPELEQMRVLTVVDTAALALLCDAYAEYVEAREVLRTEGRTYETINAAGGVMVRVRPEVAIASDAWKRVRSMLAEFGMTPSSRTRLRVEPEQAEDDFMEWLLNRPRQGAE